MREKHRLQNRNDFVSGLPNLAVIIILVIMLDQMKVEALRTYLLDYQHYLFAMFGMFCGLKKLNPDRAIKFDQGDPATAGLPVG